MNAEYCPTCIQITNHDGAGECLKCKASPSSSCSLLPCPFCGGAVKSHFPHSHITCDDCVMSCDFPMVESIQQVVEAWNFRANAESSHARNER